MSSSPLMPFPDAEPTLRVHDPLTLPSADLLRGGSRNGSPISPGPDSVGADPGGEHATNVVLPVGYEYRNPTEFVWFLPPGEHTHTADVVA